MRMKIRSLLVISFIIFPLFVFAANDIQKAEQLYHNYCSQCHGLEGDGFGVNSYDMEIAPRDHTDTNEMSARTDEDLFKAIKFGGKAVNKSILMPPWEGVISDADIHLIIKHLRKLCCEGK